MDVRETHGLVASRTRPDRVWDRTCSPGYKIPVIEDPGATLDQFDAIDFSDSEIRKLEASLAEETEDPPGEQQPDMNAIANASTLAEVERRTGLLQSGQIPGRERRAGPSNDREEEMEEDTVANGS
ncbi:U2 small nuclear ribonucleoprotein A'-like isoform X2 [Eptesicus fuscus]|uniref:U2 small nuclear ribonucleoprotein A'-like isoform X2 n=1 Tax=Eptesicus fuscus TaxID=29078 RepID=UPI0024042860|nr:U2 small nuclear ribonucleoprotein A'-like isoform X2 [Eptesicus fuscus]